MPLTPSSRAGSSPSLRAEDPALPPLRQKRRAREPLVPSLRRVRPGLVTALRDHEPLRPPRGWLLPRCPVQWGSVRASMSSTLICVNPILGCRSHLLRIASKHQHHGRTSRRASCNRIVNPRARLRSLENPSLSRWPASFEAELRASRIRGRYAFAARRWTPSSPLARRRRQPLATPTRHRADTHCRKLVTRSDTRSRISPASYGLADSDILAITELREGVFTNLPGEAACLRRPLLQDFERRRRPRSLFRHLHPGCLLSMVTHCWVSCYPQVVTNLWMDEVPALANPSQEKTRFSPWINEPSP